MSADVDSDGIEAFKDGHIRPLHLIEVDAILLALAHYDNNVAKAARRLGIGRSTLYRRMIEAGIASGCEATRDHVCVDVGDENEASSRNHSKATGKALELDGSIECNLSAAVSSAKRLRDDAVHADTIEFWKGLLDRADTLLITGSLKNAIAVKRKAAELDAELKSRKA